MATSEDLAWLAGFYDGEGHCAARDNSSGGRQIKVQITQKDRRVLDKIVEITGGKIYPHPGGWSWQLARKNDVMLFCWKIWPWLGEIKQDQFDKAFHDFKLLGRKGGVLL